MTKKKSKKQAYRRKKSLRKTSRGGGKESMSADCKACRGAHRAHTCGKESRPKLSRGRGAVDGRSLYPRKTRTKTRRRKQSKKPTEKIHPSELTGNISSKEQKEMIKYLFGEDDIFLEGDSFNPLTQNKFNPDTQEDLVMMTDDIYHGDSYDPLNERDFNSFFMLGNQPLYENNISGGFGWPRKNKIGVHRGFERTYEEQKKARQAEVEKYRHLNQNTMYRNKAARGSVSLSEGRYGLNPRVTTDK